jgi:hypothetical protein
MVGSLSKEAKAAEGESEDCVDLSQECPGSDGARQVQEEGDDRPDTLARSDAASTEPQQDMCQQTELLAAPMVIHGQDFFQVSLSDGVSLQLMPRATSSSMMDDAISGWSASSMGEPLVSLHGPNEDFRGRIMDTEVRAAVASQEEAALSKMRHFCASILKKLAPPLLKEIESSCIARSQVATTPPRRITRAAMSTPAPRTNKKVSVAESVKVHALAT